MPALNQERQNRLFDRWDKYGPDKVTPGEKRYACLACDAEIPPAHPSKRGAKQWYCNEICRNRYGRALVRYRLYHAAAKDVVFRAAGLR